MALKNYTFLQICQMLIIPAFFATLKMLLISGVLSTIFGFFLGVILILTEKNGLCENRIVNRILDFLVNTIRSFPFIILMISIIPFTRLIVGSSIGDQAAIVPLTVACTPFMARIFQNSFKEVDPALIEAAQSFGASKSQIVMKVMLKESVPSIISGLCLAIINLLGATAMAGAVGAGGLGAIALTYGYQNFNKQIMYSICVILIILVAFIQYFGDWIYRKLK
ncbi:methionine ABC transporter permease [Faecalicatena contorta]|jgi:D-methionine transport system permease protein|uniref:D-methionine transport system permease protein n=1 Tax=Faecalicatena contorta TaxID=39482 RepID=A0A315ZV83_9FIRM|nr:methionine ABC transporter permease [Faecalicatena contorta]MBA4698343.1 ABC transporter permease [Ruminococcus sp.]PWJ48554.1 D-methionine transport system permease protein [Faecalicatena contorta]SUQ15290.1 D-methionine transport system permease protein [Faecalicatena contorta]